MAKSKLPSVDDVAPITAPVQPNPPAFEVTANASAVAVAEPVDSQPAAEGYLPRSVDVRLKSMSHRRALRDKLRQLQDRGATLADGSPVQFKADVVRWMLENVEVA